MENESTALVYGRGCVDLRFSSGKVVSLLNVLHVPNIRKNLVSSNVLNNCGYKQTKKKPNLNYLRAWGYRAAVRLSNPKLKTLGERGIECIFVGYAEHSKAFMFYVIKPNDLVIINSIIESMDTIFDEQKFSSFPRPGQRSLVKRIKDSGGSVVSERVTDEIVQQSELKKAKGIGLQMILGLNFNYT
nr:zinc finger, CCHC-type [Tanacetum cinerariifolium]